jgi:hypothetical protein
MAVTLPQSQRENPALQRTAGPVQRVAKSPRLRQLAPSPGSHVSMTTVSLRKIACARAATRKFLLLAKAALRGASMNRRSQL